MIMVIEERRVGAIINASSTEKNHMNKSGTKSSKQSDTPQFTIDEEFKNLLPPLSPEDFEQLERSILKDGCRDPLVIWKKEKVLVDGHHRFSICQTHALPYGIEEMSFDSREDVVVWMMENQKSRRNMNKFQWAEVVLRCKETIAVTAKANQVAGGGAVRQKSDKPVRTLGKLAKLAGLSHDTMNKIEYILHNASRKSLNALRRGDTGVSVNGVYTELREQEYEMEKEAEFTPKSKKKSRQRSSRVLPKVKREPQPSQEDLDIEINNLIESFMDIEERLPLDCVNIYAELEDWIRKRKTKLVQALVPK